MIGLIKFNKISSTHCNHTISLLPSKDTTLRVISRRQRKANFLTYLVVTDDLVPNPSEIELSLYIQEDPKLNTSTNQSVVDALPLIDVGWTVTSFTGVVKYLAEKSNTSTSTNTNTNTNGASNGNGNGNSNSSINAKKKKI